MHRSRKSFRGAVLVALFTFVSLMVVPTASADNDLVSDGEPTDPQEIVDSLREIGIDLAALGLSVTSPFEVLLSFFRSLVTPPEDSGS